MRILAFAIIAASAFGDDPGPAELVRLLGSADRVEREEAARTLEELGVAALPALHDAEKAGPVEARSKAASLARLIEGRRSTVLRSSRSTSMASPWTRRSGPSPPGAATRSSSTPGTTPALPRRPIVAQAPAPISFWEVLDMIGRAGHVRHDPGAELWDRTRVPVLHIADGEPPSSTLYRGPFRVHLAGLHRRRDLELGRQSGTRAILTGRALCRFAGVRRAGPIPGLRRTAAPRGRGRPRPSSPGPPRRRRAASAANPILERPGRDRGLPVAAPARPARSAGH